MENRLQFVHCETLFKTSIEAKEYVTMGDLISFNRPALYAEPMVLKYGDEKNPNIILAIGSVGDGKKPSKFNQVFFIDFADVENSINEIKEQLGESSEGLSELKSIISNIITACGLNENGNYVADVDDENLKLATSLTEADKLLSKAISDNYSKLLARIDAIDSEILTLKNFEVEETQTIKHQLVKDESGSTLSSNVKIANYKTVGNCNLNNIILTQEDGIFSNVRMEYNPQENKLIFGVNDSIQEFMLPIENHVIDGSYDTKTESLILNLKEPIDGNDTISIDLSKLIGEWKVMGEFSDTPIILTKEAVKSEDRLRGADDYQDILKADVRIAESDYKPYNILKKTENGKALYVDGIADNIKYLKNGKIITVKQALDEVDCNVSQHDGNIIFRKEDGIFSNVELEYITNRNTLKFTKTDKDGGSVVKEIELNNISFLETIYYDSLTEEIVITYKDANGEIKEIRVPVSSLLEEWEVDNTNHTVTLTKTEHQTAGKDKLSADVNIASTSDNILRVVGHALHVKGTSDNIRHNNITVKDALDAINGDENIEGSIRNIVKQETLAREQADLALQSNIDAERDRAILAETENKAGIQANSTAIKDETLRATSAETENKTAISNEVLRATGEEKRIEDKFDTAINKQSTVNSQITEAIKNLDSSLKSEIERSTNKDSEFDTALTKETERAKGEETRIYSEFTAHKTTSEGKISTLESSLADEIANRTNADGEINIKLGEIERNLASEVSNREKADTQITNDISRVSDALQVESTKLDSLQKTVEQQGKDLTCSVENTESITLTKASNSPNDGYKLSGKVNVSTANKNIINKDGALFASVDLSYNSATNVLTLITSNNDNKDITLNVGSIIKHITYDSDSKELVIVYDDEDGVEQTVNVPVSDLYNEWVVEDRDTSVIRLEKVIGGDGKPDVLKADLKLATPESGNLLQNTNGNLYASNKALDIKLSDSVGTNVETAIVNINNRLTSIEGSVGGNTSSIEELEKTVSEHTSRLDGIDTTIDGIQDELDALKSGANLLTEDTNTTTLTLTKTEDSSTLKVDVKISAEPDNIIQVKDDGLYITENYDFGTY